MPLYNTPLEPTLQLSVNTVKTNIASVGAFNTLYLLAYANPTSTFAQYGAELITSLEDYKERIGGAVPTDYLELVNYLSVSAAYKNMKGLGVIKVIPVRAPAFVYVLQISVTRGVTSGDFKYSLDINGELLEGFITVPAVLPSSYTNVDNYLTDKFSDRIKANLALKNSVYIRDVTNSIIEITPVISDQSLTFINRTPLAGPAFSIGAAMTPASNTIPEGKDYIQALELSLKEEDELGVIVAPGFYATSNSAESELFTKQLDSFCRGSVFQQLAIRDVVNPDLAYVTDYETILEYNPGLPVAINQLIKYSGSLYKGAAAGLLAIPVAVSGITGLLAMALADPVTINGVTGNIVKGLTIGAGIANVAAPTAIELLDYRVVSIRELINTALFLGELVLVEAGSSTEQALYKFRDNFDSIEGNVSIAAPYLNYLGSELSLEANFPLPASVYQASLWIYVANSAGVFTPPGSDDFALEGTKGPIWQVSSAGHALLNGKGINIIKTINGSAYVMGARTLAQNDIYNRQNARLILSLYVRTLRSALKFGLVIKPLTSSGAFLNELKAKADAVSRTFYQAGLFDGGSEGEAFDNKCDATINPLSAIQQGTIRLESKFAQIGMTEKITVTVQESLLGALNSIL